MHKLSGLDAGFLYAETGRVLQHIASVQILETPPGGLDQGRLVSNLRTRLLERAHLIPYFYNKLQSMPFGIDHPVWVRDDAFDIRHHVLTAEVPAPGGRRELEETVAELHARPLDRSRPLWELWLLTGLRNGQVACYNRVHHACVDGVGGQRAVQAIMDTTPEEGVPPESPGRADEAIPGPVELLAGAAAHLAAFQMGQVGRIPARIQGALRLWQRAIDPSRGLGAALVTAPRTRFNQVICRRRSYATAEASLDDVTRIGAALGVTVNDVVLGVVSGGLRRYLLRTGELPAATLIAGCPVSLRHSKDVSASNQVTMMAVALATDEPDPVKRLLKIGCSAVQGKGVAADLADSIDPDIALPGLPAVMMAWARVMEAGSVMDWATAGGVPYNLVVSNVPGPRRTLYSGGARMLTHYPVSAPANGLGVNVTVQSYAGHLYFGITGCAVSLPDPGVLRDDLMTAFDELRLRVLPAAPPRERRMPGRSTTGPASPARPGIQAA